MVIWEGRDASEQEVAARNWLPLALGLSENGIDLRFVLLGRGRWMSPALADCGFAVTTLNAPSLYAAPLRVPRLIGIIRKLRPDLVHAQEVVPAIVAGLAGRLVGMCPVIFHRQHGVGSLRLIAASRLATRLTRFTFAVSEAIGQVAIVSDRRAPDAIRVAPNGSEGVRSVSNEERRALRGELDIGVDDLVVSIVARLRASKNHLRLIEAAERAAAATETAVHLVIVGAGPERSRIERAAASASIPVHLVGHQSDVSPYLAISDVAALPSLLEPWGFSVAEAMAAGVPVLGSKIGGIPELIGEEGGVLVDPLDIADMAQKLTDLLQDESRRNEMGAAGRKRFQRHLGAEAAARRWRECYNEVIDACKRGR